MNWLSEKLNIKTMEDWYNVSCEVYIKLNNKKTNKNKNINKK